MSIRFILNGEVCEEKLVSPSMTVLDYLREVRGLKGTKEGCAEGDCGACTIAVGHEEDGHTIVEATNACLMMVPQLEGKTVRTVEGISDVSGGLHPVQRALVEMHGAQCGFCTPGIVMALYAHHQSGGPYELDAIHDTLAGNLCRCTGYRPIVDAAQNLANIPAERGNDTTLSASGSPETYEANGNRFHTPRSLDRLLSLRADFPDASLLGGGTDLGILASKDRHHFPDIIWTGCVPELQRIERGKTAVTIGAAVTYTSALPIIDELYPSFAALIRRIGSRQIRNLGTLGGNICNASPIGDTPPCLIALEAVFIARSRNGVREIKADAFFIDYRKTALTEGEVLEAIRLPLPADDQIFRAYKISKRFDQDISAVIGAYALTIRNGSIEKARVAYGGMAATPLRASGCEGVLQGAMWSEETAIAASNALKTDFNPITDFRASADYRRKVAANLIHRLFSETSAPHQTTEIMTL
jgi:xanthine dehydrogenase small subunit